MAGGDWRHGGGGGGAKRSEPTRGTSRRSWQPGGKSDAPTGKRRSRTGRLLLAGLAAGVLLALIIVVIWLLRPARYPDLVIVAPKGSTSLALSENVAGQNSAAALAEWSSSGSESGIWARGDRMKPIANRSEDTSGHDTWASKLNKSTKPVVLYFTAHGGADADGPYLWFVSADAPTKDHKLPVKDILNRLAGQPKDQHKLLIFDTARVPTSWVHGSLFNDFARALRELDDTGEIAKIDNLAVICASSEDERAWVSEEWRQSVFGHYLIEGLKGDGASPNERITADRLFDYVAGKVEKWASINRDLKQTPILLPKDRGRKVAEQIELAAVPASGYQPTPIPDPAPNITESDELGHAWQTAWELATKHVPPPDATDPAKWRRYLELLLRWERLARLGENADTLRTEATRLATELNDGPTTKPRCLPTALPVNRAFGLPTPSGNATTFNELWTNNPPTTRAGWKDRSDVTRVAIAAATLDKVRDLQPTPDVLNTAEEVLALAIGADVGPAEAHFVRMLNRNLDPKSSKRPLPDRLKKAIELRIEAEQVAWVGGIGPKAHPYAEQTFRWVRERVQKGDVARELGQDLLFDANPKSWDEAENTRFKEAKDHYVQAQTDAGIVAAALAYRDKVFARLPYYGRWVANRRMPPTELEKLENLIVQVQTAAANAHAIAKQARTVPETQAERAVAIGKFRDLTTQGEAAFKVVKKAFDDDVLDLSQKSVVLPANWHALENALSVPFIPANTRVQLLASLRHISAELANPTRGDEGKGIGNAPKIPARELAERQGRVAIAILDDPTDTLKKSLGRGQHRETGELIGQWLRELPRLVSEELQRAAAAPDLAAAAPHIEQAAYLTRLADPAAPVGVSRADDPLFTGQPVAIEQRYWQHFLLLWQAERTNAAGWADLTSGPPDKWYCREVGQLYTKSARELIGAGDGSKLTPDQDKRRTNLVVAVEKLRPVVFEVKDDYTGHRLGLADDPSFTYRFSVIPNIPKAGSIPATLGFPVYEVTPPGSPYTVPNPELMGRKLLDEYVRAGATGELTKSIDFKTVSGAKDPGKPGKLTTTVLYRGYKPTTNTDIALAGDPSLDWRYIPPKGNAAFAVLANHGDMGGAVTVMLDLTKSMNTKINAQGKSRLQEMFDGLGGPNNDAGLLKELPTGTKLTIGFFYGDEEKKNAITRVLIEALVWDRTAVQQKSVMDQVRKLEAIGESTPIAKTIGEVLSKDVGKKFWPERITGTRTLLILTDGEDTWPGDAGKAALAAMLDAPQDVNLHLVFFAMDPEDERKAITQFGLLERPEHFREKRRTPATLWRKVRSAKELVDQLKNAMLPKVDYRGKGVAGQLPVSLPGEGSTRRSGGLQPGDYDLESLQPIQKLQLARGDRVILKTRPTKNDGGFELFVPPYAFDAAFGEKKFKFASVGDSQAGLHLTIPRLRLEESTEALRYNLDMVATMEPFGGWKPNPLRHDRPLLPWFEVSSTDGKPPAPDVKTRLRVVNKGGVETPDGERLAVPAWNVTAEHWDTNGDLSTARPPTLSAYWVASWPAHKAEYLISLGDLPRSVNEQPSIADVKIVSAEYESAALESGTKGDEKYLTLRLKYKEPDKPLLFPRDEFTRVQQHVYFDSVERYTVRLGPYSPEERTGTLALRLYSVTALKAQAEKFRHAVRLDIAGLSGSGYDYLKGLQLEPAKE